MILDFYRHQHTKKNTYRKIMQINCVQLHKRNARIKFNEQTWIYRKCDETSKKNDFFFFVKCHSVKECIGEYVNVYLCMYMYFERWQVAIRIYSSDRKSFSQIRMIWRLKWKQLQKIIRLYDFKLSMKNHSFHALQLKSFRQKIKKPKTKRSHSIKFSSFPYK